MFIPRHDNSLNDAIEALDMLFVEDANSIIEYWRGQALRFGIMLMATGIIWMAQRGLHGSSVLLFLVGWWARIFFELLDGWRKV
jgi:hypothetical protein